MRKNRSFQYFFIKTAIISTFVGAFSNISFAKEGMWLPPLLGIRAADMKKEGLEIPIDQLYNNQGTGLNNAVVLFGKGCTGEIISSQGLVLTNHHCGYGSVQGISNLEHDYFATGFWAMNKKEEIPCPGLTVTFVRKMENVTDKILYNLPDTLNEGIRESFIAGRISALEKGYKYATKLDAKIEPFYRGNQYWVILTETYKDIRLVGFPPNGIGFFGGDTDNWMWPRHNGDFSIFRVYAGKNNAPSDFNKTNKPYQPKRFFSINTSGYKEKDFTMVYGFPGTTQEYITSAQLSQISKIADPISIEVRTKKLSIWGSAMAANREVFLKYTSKRAGVANGWKKWQGEERGLRINEVPNKKAANENSFQNWANVDTSTPYADNLLSQMQATTGIANNALRAEQYIREAILGIELIQQGSALEQLLLAFRNNKQGQKPNIETIKNQWIGFQKNYDANTDQQLFTGLMPIFMKACPDYIPSTYSFSLLAAGNDYQKWSNNVYRRSMVSDPQRWSNLISGQIDTNQILMDPAWQLYHTITQVRNEKIKPIITNYTNRMARLNRLYMAAQMIRDQGRTYYPDANLSLRLTYGHVKGIDPEGPAAYSFQTNVDEIIAKDQPDVEEFRVPQKLKNLVAKHDYGRWGIPNEKEKIAVESAKKESIIRTLKSSETTVPVAFLADNHTSGGNSGSPVLNAKGELIGTNFDRIWEGTMSDLYFDPTVCRNISVDVRYTLWVIEKFGGASWLLKEMKLVK